MNCLLKNDNSTSIHFVVRVHNALHILDLGQANLPLVSDQLSNLNNVEFKGYFSMPVGGLCNPCSL